jgi:hypothetical protein
VIDPDGSNAFRDARAHDVPPDRWRDDILGMAEASLARAVEYRADALGRCKGSSYATLPHASKVAESCCPIGDARQEEASASGERTARIEHGRLVNARSTA